MKTELELVRQHPSVQTKGTRKRLNEAANSLLHDAILKNDLPALSAGLADTMIVTARILNELELEPELDNFAYACAELVSTVRKAFDDALRFNNADDTKLAAVMLEVVLKGIATTLGLSLEELMRTELEKETK